jgi:hypothetical protein
LITSFLTLLHFSKNNKGASVGRSFLFRKIALLLQKAFHFTRVKRTGEAIRGKTAINLKSVSLSIKFNLKWQQL